MSKEQDESKNKSFDLREGNLRYLGYAHIFGELFRRWLSRQGLNLCYATTTAYVLADTVNQCRLAHNKNENGRNTLVKAADSLIWHTGASVFIPSFVVRKIKWGTEYWLLNMTSPKLLRLNVPLAVCILSIPIIIHPIDRLMNYLMDETYRNYVN